MRRIGNYYFKLGSTPKVFFLIILCMSSVFLVTAQAAVESAEEPRYSQLYDQLEKLEKDNKLLQALSVIPEIYAQEDIPVDSFYDALDKKRNALLDKMIKQEASCSKLVKPFSDFFIKQTNAYHYKIRINNHLSFKKFCYLMAIEGEAKEKGEYLSVLDFQALSTPALQKALQSSDPWLVAAAIFYARSYYPLNAPEKKQKNPLITPQAVIKRWEKRPDLWDEQCTQQALLFLAQLDPKSLKKLKISNEDIALALNDLERVPSTKSYLSPLLYSVVDNQFNYIDNPNITLIKLEKDKHKKGTIKRWAGDKNQLLNLKIVDEKKISAEDYDDDGVLPVKPGLYKVDFNSVEGDPPSGFYGKSALIDVKGGRFIIVPVAAFPAI